MVCNNANSKGMARRQSPLFFVALGAFLKPECKNGSMTQRRCQYYPLRPQARISDSLPAYRFALLKNCTEERARLSSTIAMPTKPPVATDMTASTAQTTTSASATTEFCNVDLDLDLNLDVDNSDQSENDIVMEESTHSRSPPVRHRTTTYAPVTDTRFMVRTAEKDELYTAADIRCEAFYCSAQDSAYHPVRRREIYMAMQSRVAAGTCCVIITDNQPPREWLPLASHTGLVVGTLDITLHGALSGLRHNVDAEVIVRDRPQLCGYISSMAVRQCWQGGGLAQRLMAFTKQLISNLGVTDIYLHVDWENECAVHLYRKCGFRVVQSSSPAWLYNLAKPEHTLMHLKLILGT